MKQLFTLVFLAVIGSACNTGSNESSDSNPVLQHAQYGIKLPNGATVSTKALNVYNRGDRVSMFRSSDDNVWRIHNTGHLIDTIIYDTRYGRGLRRV